MPINILYHDVTLLGDEDASGFPGPEAKRYKLTVEEFDRNLDSLRQGNVSAPLASVAALHSGPLAKDWTMSFDDGGISSVFTIADRLERRGWRAWFFISTDFLGKPGFCSRRDIQRLHRLGHVIGSHTCSHPERLSACTWSTIVDEWSRSCNILADIVGEPITAASVPGGFYSTQVARAASKAKITVLFNSEPTIASQTIDDCLVLGRYSIIRGMRSDATRSLLTNSLSRLAQKSLWNTKKIAKVWIGPQYKALRKIVLRRIYGSQ